jgi:hypothetical protein
MLQLSPEGQNAITSAYVPSEASVLYEDGSQADADALQAGARVYYKGRLRALGSIYIRRVSLLNSSTSGIVSGSDGRIVTIQPDDGRTITRVLLTGATAYHADPGAAGPERLVPGARVVVDGRPGIGGTIQADRLGIVSMTYVSGDDARRYAKGIVTGRSGNIVTVTPEYGYPITTVDLSANPRVTWDAGTQTTSAPAVT